MYGEDFSKVVNCCKISLNILRLQNKGNYNMRTFEVPVSGGFMLAERSIEAQEFFAEGKEAAYFSTTEELRDKIRYYLSHEDTRREIAQAGYQRCVSCGHTYLERAKQILKVYEEFNRGS